MIFVFEDDRRHILSTFYERGVAPALRRNFLYSNGNGNLEAVVLRETTASDIIVVFLDMYPDNPELVRIYNKLARCVGKRPNLFVIPIVCREFVFLQSIVALNYALDQEVVDAVRRKASKAGYTLEAWCKLLCREYVMECARTDVSSSKADCLRPYFSQDCDCCNCNEEHHALHEKVNKFITGFGCDPRDLLYLSDERAIPLLNQAQSAGVSAYNQCVDVLSFSGDVSGVKRLYIRDFRERISTCGKSSETGFSKLSLE